MRILDGRGERSQDELVWFEVPPGPHFAFPRSGGTRLTMRHQEVLVREPGKLVHEALEEHADPGPEEVRFEEGPVLGEVLGPLLLHEDLLGLAVETQPLLEAPLPLLLLLLALVILMA